MSELPNGEQDEPGERVSLRQIEEMVERCVARALAKQPSPGTAASQQGIAYCGRASNSESTRSFNLDYFKERVKQYQISTEQEDQRLKAYVKRAEALAAQVPAQSEAHGIAPQIQHQNAPQPKAVFRLGDAYRRVLKSILGFFGGRPA